MSLNSDKLSDIKSLYENIHFSNSEEFLTEETENLDEAGNPGAAGAMQARNQRIAAQGQVKTALGQGKGIALQSASGTGAGTKPDQKAFGTQLGGRQGVVVKGGAAGPNLGPRGGSSFSRAADTVNVGGQTLYKAQRGKDIVYLQGKGGPQLFKPGQQSPAPGSPRPGAPGAPPRPGTPGAAPRPGAGAPAPVGGAKAAPSGTPAGTPPVGGKPAPAPMSAMDKWRAANPKLAAAADEKARIRGTAQTDNPLMKDMRSGMRAGAPTVQSPAVAKLGAGNQSLVNNPNAGRSPAPAPTSGAGAFNRPTIQTPAAKPMSTSAGFGAAKSTGFGAVSPSTAVNAAPSTSPAASGSVVPATNRLAATPRPVTPNPSAGMLRQSFDYDDLYDLVIEYLIDDGHADTLDEAAYIISEMEATTIADIVEAKYGTAKGRKALARKVRAGKDVGKKGEGFKKIVKDASKKYGKERATKIAAAAMWKNLAKE